MTSQEKDIEFIARFFDFDLSETELITFEKRLLEDTKFNEKVNTYQKANTIVNKNYNTEESKLRLQKWENLLDNNTTLKTKKTMPWKWISGIAAGFILLFFVWQKNTVVQKPDMDQLIAQSWNKQVGLDFSTTRGNTTDSLKQPIIDAFITYRNKDYQATINVLNHYKTVTRYYEDVLLLKGLSYYKQGKTDIALKTLDTLSLSTNEKRSKVAKWYKGLIYLEQGNIEQAKKLLIIPTNQGHEIRLK
ncbi:tetratricopeptide repeat protein [uncultured Algibacter sp.]|uniref:tetratricopeptide repeat protein n=1 Tax=uncultured Algibacter sp. TaxID=298659 RepID=UPI0032166C66